MLKTILTALVVSGTLSATALAQTAPTNRPAPTNPARKTGQAMRGTAGHGNSGDTAPNRSTTAGESGAATSNNPVDATGKPVNATPSNNTSTVKAPKPKN